MVPAREELVDAGFQPFHSPMTETSRALGAQTARWAPSASFAEKNWQPRTLVERRVRALAEKVDVVIGEDAHENPSAERPLQFRWRSFWPSMARRDERDAFLRHVEALAVLLRVDAGAQARRDLRPLVDQHAREHRASSHLHVGQQHALVEGAEAVHAHVREQHRVAHLPSR
jgi:hypothetical protein